MTSSYATMTPELESTFGTRFAQPYMSDTMPYPYFFKYSNMNAAGGIMSNIKGSLFFFLLLNFQKTDF